MVCFFIGIGIVLIGIIGATQDPAFIIFIFAGFGLGAFGAYQWANNASRFRVTSHKQREYPPCRRISHEQTEQEFNCKDFSSAASVLTQKTINSIQEQKKNIVNSSPYHVLDFTIFLMYTYYFDLTELSLNDESQNFLDEFIESAKATITNNFKNLENNNSLFKLRFAAYRRIFFSSSTNQQKREDLSFLLIKYLTADNIDPVYSPYSAAEIRESDLENTLKKAPEILEAQQLVYSNTISESCLLFNFLNFEN